MSHAFGVSNPQSAIAAASLEEVCLTPDRQVIYPLSAKTRFPDFLLGDGEVIRYAAQFDGSFVHIVNRVSRLGIVVTRLPDGADVYKVLFAGLHLKLCVGAASDNGVADEDDRHLRMPAET